jgi:hypothetical protein
MIDFISTRSNADEQSIACARLLTAVIATAVMDLAGQGTRADRLVEFNDRKVTNHDALSSIRFFFGSHSPFPLYAKLIGSSAEDIRGALLGKRKATDTFRPLKPLINDAQWSAIHRRLNLCGILDVTDVWNGPVPIERE